MEKILAGVSIYDPVVNDTTDTETYDSPESAIVQAIYRVLEEEGYDRFAPMCDVRIEANLYDYEYYTDTGERV